MRPRPVPSAVGVVVGDGGPRSRRAATGPRSARRSPRRRRCCGTVPSTRSRPGHVDGLGHGAGRRPGAHRLHVRHRRPGSSRRVATASVRCSGRPWSCRPVGPRRWPARASTPTLLGTSARTDGTTQITYNGWPLYLWPPDRAPGKATGQALTNAGGLWYVLSPAGHPIVTPSP